MKSKEAIIYANGRILAISMKIDNCKSKEELEKLNNELSFLYAARSALEKQIKPSKKGKL